MGRQVHVGHVLRLLRVHGVFPVLLYGDGHRMEDQVRVGDIEWKTKLLRLRRVRVLADLL